MQINEAAKIICEISEKAGLEFAFTEHGTIDLYWKSIRIQPEIKDLGKVLRAIGVLNNVGAEVN